LIDLPSAIFQAVFGIVLLSLYHPLFIVLGVVLTLLLYTVLRFTGKKAIATALEESDNKYKVANWLEEIARAITTFKLAGHSGLAIDKTDRYVGQYIRARESHFSILRTQYYSFVIFKILITAVLLLLGLKLMIDRQLNIGQFIAAEIVIIMIMNSIEKIILKIDDVYDVMAGVEKISKITGLPVEQNGALVLPIKKNEGIEVSFRNLTYSFPNHDTPAIDHLDLQVQAGERICISGSNGSGKSTLLQLLLGIYLPQEGAVSFNGIPLKNLDKSTLMNHVGNYISQDTLFDGTLLENITMGRKFLKQEDLFWSIEVAGLRRFVDSLPDGLSTRLVGGGARISESTAHKIIMARNLAERPSLFVVDDFLLGVEQSTKRDILRLLTDKKHHWTVFMASNDPMVMQASDRIVMMENGKIKSIDTPERLKEQGMFKNSDQSENN
jgi:ABC-type bacteriocin/lantibiotic exporter with double-glycine peptidase domain